MITLYVLNAGNPPDKNWTTGMRCPLRGRLATNGGSCVRYRSAICDGFVTTAMRRKLDAIGGLMRDLLDKAA